MLSIRRIERVVYGLAAAMACTTPPAHGQGPIAQADGNTEIVGTVSTGVSFDVASRLLTSIFVTGRVGDTVSIFTPTTIRTELSRDIALASATQIATLDDITILSRGTVSVNLQQVRESTDTSLDYGKSFFVILAQFN